jgi:trigger factor
MNADETISSLPLENQMLELDNENTLAEFREGLKGARQDEKRDIRVDYPEDYPDEKFVGKSVTYAITVKEIKERVLPQLNDDFAKLLGQGETLLELKLKVREQLNANLQEDIKRSVKKQMIDQIVEQNAIDVPEIMMESYLKNVIEDYKKDGSDFDEAELREKYRPISVNAIRWYLLYHRMAQQEKVEVSPEDTENWVKRFAENYRMDVPKAKELLAKTGKASEIRDGILEEKVLEFLMSKATAKKG